MPPRRAPSTADEQLRWLVDRAEISDVLIAFARALDDHDPDAYAGLYADDGVLELPGGIRMPRDDLADGVRQTLGIYDAVFHLSANHAIDIDGDTARTRSYLIAVHRHGEDVFDHATGSGWYDNTLRRTSEGWRLTSVRLTLVWRSGDGPLPGEAA